MDGIVILGFGGHAQGVADSIIKAGKYNIIGYTDVAKRNSRFRYLGSDERLGDLYESGVCHAVLGVGYLGWAYVRDALVGHAKSIGFDFPVIIDPSAAIAVDAAIGEGTFVGKNAVVNAGAKIGRFCIINTGAVVEHGNRIGDYSHIAVGAALCGDVRVGGHTVIGANAAVLQGKKIGDKCMVGAGSIVLSDVGNKRTVYGVVGGGE